MEWLGNRGRAACVRFSLLPIHSKYERTRPKRESSIEIAFAVAPIIQFPTPQDQLIESAYAVCSLATFEVPRGIKEEPPW